MRSMRPLVRFLSWSLHRTAHEFISAVVFPVLLIYDSVLTAAAEVDLIWRRKMSVASLIYIANRASAAMGIVYILLLDTDSVSYTLMYESLTSHHYLRCKSLGCTSSYVLNTQTAGARGSCPCSYYKKSRRSWWQPASHPVILKHTNALHFP